VARCLWLSAGLIGDPAPTSQRGRDDELALGRALSATAAQVSTSKQASLRRRTAEGVWRNWYDEHRLVAGHQNCPKGRVGGQRCSHDIRQHRRQPRWAGSPRNKAQGRPAWAPEEADRPAYVRTERTRSHRAHHTRLTWSVAPSSGRPAASDQADQGQAQEIVRKGAPGAPGAPGSTGATTL